VLCFNAINHVHDIQNSLNKISKWVKPNGKVLLSVDAHNYLLLKKVFTAIPGDVLHPHQYTLQEYIMLCRAAELNNEKIVLLKSGRIFSHYLILLTPKKNGETFF
jgi:2-polyprenyl-6-hydroxyphenyl methylase/3-demethylubiquinone-9 3-methyltransferase